MKEPKLTIIIPLYKTQLHHILPLMGSYSNQYFLKDTLTELLFLYDDTVEEEILDFIKKVLQDIPNYLLTFVKSENTASGYKRNLGIKIAKGEYVWFNDQDDWLANQLSLINIHHELLNEPDKKHFICDPNTVISTAPVISRPWMHILKKDFAAKYKFAEDKEWAADQEFVYAILKDEKVPYIPAKKQYIISYDLKNIYTWNNINPDSYSVSQVHQEEYKKIFKDYL